MLAAHLCCTSNFILQHTVPILALVDTTLILPAVRIINKWWSGQERMEGGLDKRAKNVSSQFFLSLADVHELAFQAENISFQLELCVRKQ